MSSPVVTGLRRGLVVTSSAQMSQNTDVLRILQLGKLFRFDHFVVLNNSVHVKAHDYLGNVADEIVQPIINTREYVNRLVGVAANTDWSSRALPLNSALLKIKGLGT